MGQANRRGTHEERKTSAIKRDKAEMIERERRRLEREHEQANEDARKGYGTLLAMAAIAYGVTLPPRLTGTVRRMGR